MRGTFPIAVLLRWISFLCNRRECFIVLSHHSWLSADCTKGYAPKLQVSGQVVPAESLPSRNHSYRSEVDDINLGLEHFYGDFNVVHVGFIATGVRFLENGAHFLDSYSALILDPKLPLHDRSNKPCPPTGRSNRHHRNSLLLIWT